MRGGAGVSAALTTGIAGEVGLRAGALGMTAATTGGILTAGIGVGAAALGAAGLYGFMKRRRNKIMNHIINLFNNKIIIERLGKMIENNIPDPDYKFTGISEKKYKALLKKWFSYMGGRKIKQKSYTLHYLMEIDAIERNINMTLEEKLTKFYELLSGGISKYLGWWNRALIDSGIVLLPEMDRASIKEYFKISKQMRSQHKKTQKIAREANNIIKDQNENE